MNRSIKQLMLLIAFGVVLFVGLMNLSDVISFLRAVVMLILPVFIGLMLAFVLNVPISGLEKIINNFFRTKKRKPKESTGTKFSTSAVIIIIVAVIALVGTIAGPEIVRSVKNVFSLLQQKWPEWVEFLNEHNIDISGFEAWLKTTDIPSLINGVISGKVGS